MKAEITKICSKHAVKSSEELWRRVEAGELTESECLDDLMRLEYLEARLETILELLRGLK